MPHLFSGPAAQKLDGQAAVVHGAHVTGARAVGPIAALAIAGAAGAVGALAIGRLVIAEAIIRKLRAETVDIQMLTVDRLEVAGRAWPSAAE